MVDTETFYFVHSFHVLTFLALSLILCVPSFTLEALAVAAFSAVSTGGAHSTSRGSKGEVWPGAKGKAQR